ncbi:hypothetical protein KIT90_13075 [Vibrio sp. B172a]|uniref:hypothetical protein n=1 Tax=Vibrio sp. B172a TaxID=2835790 RepID=UPI00255542B2|nr:hypothetical protein [Vibrio sp. B172a]MDK9782314.1 hypothetical protein [Vibrio sp. B172a]
MSNSDVLLTEYINSFPGAAFVTDAKTAKISYFNSACLSLTPHLTVGESIKSLTEKEQNPLLRANLMFCALVEENVIEFNRTTLSTELFDKTKYLSLRFDVNFNDKPHVLTLILPSENQSVDINLISHLD